MPILANVLLRTDGKDKLLVAATDLNVTVTAELTCKVDKEGGLTVGAKHLHEIIKSLPGEDLTLKRTENHYADIKAGKVEYKVVGMPDRDYTKLPNHREVKFGKVDAATLRDMIAKTFFSISTDETRYHLNGVLFESDGSVGRAWCRPDGHRLSKIERPLEGGPKLARAASSSRARASWRNPPRAGDRRWADRDRHPTRGHMLLSASGSAGALGQADRRAVPAPTTQVIPKENDKIVRRSARRPAPRRRCKPHLASCPRTRPGASSLSVVKKGSAARWRGDNPDLGEATRGARRAATTAPRSPSDSTPNTSSTC